MPDPAVRDALAELARAIHLARPLARELRVALLEQTRAAAQLDAALDRAAAAIVDAHGSAVSS